MLRADAWTENYICTKFAQANMMQKSPNKRYIRGKDNKSQLLAFVNIMQMWHLPPLALISSLFAIFFIVFALSKFGVNLFFRVWEIL